MQTDGVTPIRLRIRQFMRTQIEAVLATGDAASLPQLKKAAREHFLGDGTFLDQVGDMVELIAYDQGKALFSGSRYGGAALYGDAVMEKEGAEQAAEDGIRQSKALSRFATWVEHAGTRYVPLMRMVDTELRAAADQRFKRSDTERELGNLWIAIADRLEGGQVVGDRFTPEEIEALQKEIVAKRNKQIINSAKAQGR